MSTRYNPSIVRDNIVLYLDAANTKSYPGSGTTWKDISGKGIDGTLTNGPTFDSGNKGSIVLDGSNDYIQLPTNSNLTFTGDFSYETWLMTDVQPASNHIWSTPGDQTFQFNSGTIIYYSTITGGQSFGSLSNNTWTHYVITRSGNTLTGYLNGAQAWTNTPNSSPTHNFSGLSIGYRTISPAGFYWDGKFAAVRMYSKGLTSTEVQQNYNALKGRFGL